jgi:transposase-like protein
MSSHRPGKRSRPFPAQLSLPLGCSGSGFADRPQNLEPSKRSRLRLLQTRLEASLAMLARLDTAPGSFPEYDDKNYFRQGQRFQVTTLHSTLINQVNGKRWSYITLPSHGKGEVAKLAKVACLSDEQAYRTFRLVRSAATNGTRKLFKCKACNHQFSVTSGTIFASRKLAIRDYLLAIAIFVNGAKGQSPLQLSRDLDRYKRLSWRTKSAKWPQKPTAQPANCARRFTSPVRINSFVSCSLQL